MEYQRFQNTVFLRLDRGEEILASLEKLSLAEHITLAAVQGLGATDDFTVGVYDLDTHTYASRTFTGPHEITSLTGNITTKEGAFYAHLHMSAGNSENHVRGGHLNRAVISVTGELILTVTDGTVERRADPVSGLNVFAFSDGKRL